MAENQKNESDSNRNSSSSSVKVCCRIRPMNKKEIGLKYELENNINLIDDYQLIESTNIINDFIDFEKDIILSSVK